MQANDTTGALRLSLSVQDASGQSSRLEFSGIDEATAVRRATARGWRVLSVETQSQVATGAGRGAARFPVVLFSQELLALLDAGLNLNEALTTLHSKQREPAARAVLGDVLQALRQGRSLSEVLAAWPRHFGDVYVATVRASERTGDLPRALRRYIDYQLQFESLRKKLVSAAIYPAMLLGVGGFVTLFLLGYVVPRFSAVYESSGREVPWMSALLLRFGKIIYNNWQFAWGGLLVLLIAAGWMLGRATARAALLDTVLRLPWLAARVDAFRLARFYRAMSLLLASGIALPRALSMVDGMLGLRQRASLAACRAAVERGQSLSAALVDARLATEVAESLVKVGERSGQMADMLERAAQFGDDEFSRWVDWASRLLEPVLMIVIGLVVGTVVMLMYMPIFDLAGSLQ